MKPPNSEAKTRLIRRVTVKPAISNATGTAAIGYTAPPLWKQGVRALSDSRLAFVGKHTKLLSTGQNTACVLHAAGRWDDHWTPNRSAGGHGRQVHTEPT